MSFQDSLAYLYSLQQFGIKLGLSNINRICLSLNNPHKRLKTIHVGGTNGKGSTAAILSSVLQQAGYKTGLYTSPHLTDISERIRINNIPINKDRFSFLIDNIKKQTEESGILPTFFEFTTALALQYFAEEGVDIAVMEVGMGGRLDATNIIVPLVTIITNVDYDHTEHLGTNLEEITGEKCGIIKKGIPVVTSETKKNVLSIIEDSAEKAGTVTYIFGRDFNTVPIKLTPSYSEFFYYGRRWTEFFIKSPLAGKHQMFNIGAALYTIELLMQEGFEITDDQLFRGVENTLWPGRLETVSLNPHVIVDGAHNHAGTVVLRRFLEDILVKEEGKGKIILVFGVLKDKDVSKMIEELIPYSSELIITRPDTERGLPVESLRTIVEQYAITPHIAMTLSEALSHAYNIASSSDTIIVTGSLYMVGEARDLIMSGFVNE
ncbi:MAG: bifunctional folylpolyglutamate synthase/dihydrofolate synthase [Nitrospira sp.]|nr:bifunctional folylpolyglutamate synthase/dihydrofolate synthase [Nitrospira sp.]